MADGASHIKQQQQQQRLNPPNKRNPSKFYSHFLFKALIITIFLATIPLFSSESPDFSTQSSFYARGWELVHLIFVGIAVSYGLFSRRNHDDSDRENNPKFDSAQSYLSRLLHFPSIFDDEVETPSGSEATTPGVAPVFAGSDDSSCNNNSSNNFQTWSSRYHRNEPMLVVAKRGSVAVEKSGIDEKPLLLPVRSLKSRVSDGNDADLVDSAVPSGPARSNSMPVEMGFSNGSKQMSGVDGGFVSGEDYGSSRVYDRSNSSLSSKGFSNDSRRMAKHGSLKSQGAVTNGFGYADQDSGVPRSLRRSSSSLSSRGLSSNSNKPSSGEYGVLDDEYVGEQEKKIEESVVLPSPIPWQSRSRTRKIELKGQSNGSTSFSPLPPTEGVDPTRSFKSQSPRSSQSKSSSSSPAKLTPSPSVPLPKNVSPSKTLLLESQAKSAEDVGRRKIVYSSRLPPPPPPPPPPPSLSRSRLVKPSSFMGHLSEPKVRGMENRANSLDSENEVLQEKVTNGIDSSLVRKSLRTNRASDTTDGERSPRETEEEPGRSSAGYTSMSNSALSEFPKETRDFLEGLLETDDDSESDDNDDNYGESKEIVKTEKLEEVPSNSFADEGPDVDKKADEFIAKFREQIRLQRIESIKRSTGQLKKSSLR